MFWSFLDEELFRGGKDDTLHLETAPEKKDIFLWGLLKKRTPVGECLVGAIDDEDSGQQRGRHRLAPHRLESSSLSICQFVILGSLRLTLEVAQTVAAVARGQL